MPTVGNAADCMICRRLQALIGNKLMTKSNFINPKSAGL
jgi:hypothetical protein